MDNNYSIKTIGPRLDIAHIKVRGCLDTVIAYQFQEKLRAMIQHGIYKYVITLSDLDYISSAGIEVFHYLKQDLQAQNGACILTNVPPKIRKLFDMIGVSTIFTIKETFEQAMVELTGRQSEHEFSNIKESSARKFTHYSP